MSDFVMTGLARKEKGKLTPVVHVLNRPVYKDSAPVFLLSRKGDKTVQLVRRGDKSFALERRPLRFRGTHNVVWHQLDENAEKTFYEWPLLPKFLRNRIGAHLTVKPAGGLSRIR
jgi:hypothetical protein